MRLVTHVSPNAELSLSPFLVPLDGAQLVTSGVYERVRHPIYAGLILAAFGAALASSSPTRFAFVLLLVAILNKKADEEEKVLLELHGGEYAAYMHATPRMIPALPVVTPALQSWLRALSDGFDAAAAVTPASSEEAPQ